MRDQNPAFWVETGRDWKKQYDSGPGGIEMGKTIRLGIGIEIQLVGKARFFYLTFILENIYLRRLYELIVEFENMTFVLMSSKVVINLRAQN